LRVGETWHFQSEETTYLGFRDYRHLYEAVDSAIGAYYVSTAWNDLFDYICNSLSYHPAICALRHLSDLFGKDDLNFPIPRYGGVQKSEEAEIGHQVDL
jgi:hypothetical protein